MAFDFGAASIAWDAFKAVRDLKVDKPTQQTAGDGVLPSLKDEAILLAVDQAVSQLTVEGPLKVDGVLVMKKIAALRSKRLKSHQNDRWRKIIATLILTEHFEKFETSVITKSPTVSANAPKEGETVNVPFPGTDSRRQNQQQSQQKKAGLHEIIRSYQRVQRDYEYTWEDPRVTHLVMVASLIVSDDPQYDHDPANGVDDFSQAYGYLLSNYFDEKSITETAIEKTKKFYEAIASGAYDALTSLGLSDDLEAAEQSVAKDDLDRVAKLNTAYEKAIQDAITRKCEQIEGHRDGVTIPALKIPVLKVKLLRTKERTFSRLFGSQLYHFFSIPALKLPVPKKGTIKTEQRTFNTYFSLSTWLFTITTLAIFVIAGMNSGG